MWIIPLLVIGAIAIAAASRSPREMPVLALPAAPPPMPMPVAHPAGLPGPISVMGEFLRMGQVPPPPVIFYAIVEAEAIGRGDLAADIVNVFVLPVVQQHEQRNMSPRSRVFSSYARGSCAPLPRRVSAYERGSCFPQSRSAKHDPLPSSRGSCVPLAEVPRAPGFPSDDEIRAMLDSDPRGFAERARRGPSVIDVPIEAQQAMPQPAAPSPTPVPPTVPPPAPSPLHADALADQLLQLPGHAGSGLVLVDPSAGTEVFEVQWLRGHPIPTLPAAVDGRAVRLVIVDDLPVAQPTGLPPETVAQMQEDAGEFAAADQTRAIAPGSPIPGVSDDAWRQFVIRLSREAPTFSSSRHVGQFRQRRERLAELGIDPSSILGSAQAQRAALDADLVDALHHAADGELLRHLGKQIAVPGVDGSQTLTLSGILGVIQCAGLDGAVGWLETLGDRRRYPHTTQAFLSTNGVF